MSETPNADSLLCRHESTCYYVRNGGTCDCAIGEAAAEFSTLKSECERLLLIEKDYNEVNEDDAREFARLRKIEEECERLRAKADLADEHASWIRRGPRLDHGNSIHDVGWLSSYDAITKEPT